MSRPGRNGLVPDTRCNATTRGGHPCKLRAGHGTEHQGEGRCKFHGGCSPGGPAGNDHAVTHGFNMRDWVAPALADAAEAVAGDSPESLRRVAEKLARDEQRIEGRLFALERHRADLEAAGRWDVRASGAYFSQVNDTERALVRVRSLQAAILAKLPPPRDAEPEEEWIFRTTLSSGLTVSVKAGSIIDQVNELQEYLDHFPHGPPGASATEGAK